MLGSEFLDWVWAKETGDEYSPDGIYNYFIALALYFVLYYLCSSVFKFHEEAARYVAGFLWFVIYICVFVEFDFFY